MSTREPFSTLLGEGAESDLLRAVLDHTEDGIVACDAAGVLRYFNRATRSMHGLPEEPLPPERWAEHYGLFAADGVTPLRPEEVPLLRALRDGAVENAEVVIVPRAGEPRHVICRGRAIVGAGGETVGAVVSMHEVSDRKALERERERVQLAQFAAVLSSVSEGVVAADAQGNVVEWNAAALAMHDFDDLAQAKMHLSRFSETFELRTLDGELLPLEAWPLSRALRGETFSQMEVCLRRLDRGWVKHLAYGGTTVRGAAGEIALAVLTIHDVTERRQAEELLARNRAQMEIVVQGANVGVWYCPLPFDRLIWDSTVKEHFHLRPDAEVTIDTFYERLHPEDREATRRAIDDSIAKREAYDIEYRTVSPDGARIKWIHAMGRGFYDAGDPRRFDGITIDITEKKRAEIELRDSERRFRHVADAAPAMLWITEPDGYCSFLSRGWYEFTGQTEEEGLGYGWANAAHPDDQAAAAEAFRDANARRAPYAIDFRLRRADGVYRWVIDAGRPRFGPGGELLGFVGSVIDVHERKEAEARLRESEARLRLAIATAQLGTFEIDLSTDAVTVNDTGREIYGWAPGEPLTFMKVRSHFHPDDAPRVQASVEDALRPDGPGEFDVEQRIVRADGAVRWIRVRGRALFEAADGGRSAVRVVGTYLDDTERREATEREALHRKLIETVIQHLPASVAIIGGRDLRYRLANASYAALARGDDVVGRTVEEVWPEVSPRFTEHCRRVLETGEPYVALDEAFLDEGETSAADAPPRFFSWSLHRVHLTGDDELGLLVTLWETTDRLAAERLVRDSEERFRQLANSIPQLAWMARPDGWIFWYNERWYEYTGTTPEQMEGWGWQRVHDPDVLPDVMERWTASIESGARFDMTFPLRGADGVLRPFLTRCAPLRDASGSIALWFGTNTDVSEQERMLMERQALLASEQAARERAEAESRLKDEFLATLSHELRTPLNAILGWSQIIRRGKVKGDDALQGMQVIERNARLQAQLVEDLLDMSRIISGTIRLDVQRVHLAEAVEAAFETVRPAAEAKGVRLVKVLDPLAGPVSGDPNRLQQVVWNLLHNAVKFTPRGGNVEVLLERVSSCLEISVRDTGEGIRPDFLPHVFDRFRQADGSSTRRHGGLGLGLSIVKQLVELHGGSVRAKSAGEGLGATFVVSLPIAPVLDEVDAPSLTRRHPTASPSSLVDLDDVPSLSGVSVLVVDDDPDSRELVRRLLEQCGAKVSVAASAPEALEDIARVPPHVLVSDIGMPGTDGYELIRRVRQLGHARGGSVPAIALTAFARSDDRRRAIAAGYQMHLAKPVDGSELVTIVASLAGALRSGPSGEAERRA